MMQCMYDYVLFVSVFLNKLCHCVIYVLVVFMSLRHLCHFVIYVLAVSMSLRHLCMCGIYVIGVFMSLAVLDIIAVFMGFFSGSFSSCVRYTFEALWFLKSGFVE